jgi:hypothetical protein
VWVGKGPEAGGGGDPEHGGRRRRALHGARGNPRAPAGVRAGRDSLTRVRVVVGRWVGRGGQGDTMGRIHMERQSLDTLQVCTTEGGARRE